MPRSAAFLILDFVAHMMVETHRQTVFDFVGRHDCPLEAACHLTLRLSKVAAMYSPSL
jgi:hypothetical protein